MLEILVFVMGMTVFLAVSVVMIAWSADQDIVVFLLAIVFGMPLVATGIVGLMIWGLS